MDRRLGLALALVALLGALVCAGCGSTEVPKGDDKPPSVREGVPTPPGEKPM